MARSSCRTALVLALLPAALACEPSSSHGWSRAVAWQLGKCDQAMMALAHDHHAAHAGGDGSDDTAATAWSDLPPLEAPVTEAGTAHAAGWVVAAGGFSYASQAATNATQLLAWPAGGTSWEALPDMPTPRHALAAAHFPALGPDTAVFVAGVLGTYVDDDGVQRTSLTNVVEALDLDGKAWLSPNALPPLPLALESPAAAALPAGALYNGGSLVVVGGFGYQANGAYFYSQVRRRWRHSTGTLNCLLSVQRYMPPRPV